MNWDELRAKQIDKESIKRLLPMDFVMDYYNITIYPHGSRFQAVCPFHNDHSPSMQIYGNSFHCFTCGAGGDVLSFIKDYEHIEFPAALERANNLLQQARESNWVSSDGETAPPIPSNDVQELLERTESNSLDTLKAMIKNRKWPVDAEWVHKTFQVNCEGSRIIIPVKDDEGEWNGYKWRQGRDKYTAAGSKLTSYYAQWLDKGRPSVVITEGEPDTWSVMQAVGKRYDVLGLPSGAASPCKEPEYFRGRDVVLAFDGDHAGRSGTRNWVGALQRVANSIRVVPIPDGFDISNINNIGEAIGKAHPVLPYTGNVEIQDGVFGWFDITGRGDKKKSDFKPICNWSITPERELRGTDGSLAYEGFTAAGDQVVITSEDLSSNAKIHYWAQQQGLGWSGSEKQAHDILIWLESQGPFISPGKMTTVIGYHEGNFVTPTRTFGKDRWVYLSKRGVDVSNLEFGYHDTWKDALRLVMKLHDPAVMIPFLSWLAVCPARSLLKEFPGLAVTGGSGIGKTTLIRTTTQAFSGGTVGGLDGLSLVDTTKHPITEHMGATNGVPFWVDEYRPSIKWETRDAIHNALLAGYISQIISKGSVMDNRGLGVTNWEHSAPLIISGENDFAETAHIERLVLLAIPEEGRNSKALSALQELLPSGIANVYLDWCINDTNLREIELGPIGPSALPPRVRTNLGVLDLGWRMLNDFADAYQIELPYDEPDWSLVISEAQRGAAENPILEAIRWAIENTAMAQERLVVNMSEEEGDQKVDYIYLRVEPLVAEVMKTRRFPLPGNARSITRILLERYGGKEVVRSFSKLKLPNDTRFIKLRKDLVS